jgi:hypothetical protein
LIFTTEDKLMHGKIVLLAILLVTSHVSFGAELGSWSNPGLFAFEGSAEDAAALHADAHSITREEFMRGVAMQQADDVNCTDYYLQDGEEIWVTYTVNGEHRLNKLVVRMVYPPGNPQAGQALPSGHHKRRIDRCNLGLDRGVYVALPYACGNWAVMYDDPVPVIIEQSLKPGISVSGCQGYWQDEPLSRQGSRFQPGFVIGGPTHLVQTFGRFGETYQPEYNSRQVWKRCGDQLK